MLKSVLEKILILFVDNVQYRLHSDKNNRHFTYKPMYVPLHSRLLWMR